MARKGHQALEAEELATARKRGGRICALSSSGHRMSGLGCRGSLHEGPRAACHSAEHTAHCFGECWLPSSVVGTARHSSFIIICLDLLGLVSLTL